MNKLFLASAVAIASVAAVPTVSQAAKQPVFTDVPETHQFYKEITNLAAQGVLTGYSDGTFLPNKEVTRAQAAKIIAVTLGLDITTVKNPNFKDVKTTDWYYPYVAVLAEKGIVQGSEGNYSPNASLTRAQMAIILTRAYELQLANELTHPFVDVKADSHYSYYVQTLLNYGITKGSSPTTYSPNTYVKRGQLAAFVTRAQALNRPTLPELQPENPSIPDGGITEQPETILQKYQSAFSNLEANAIATVDSLVSAAKAELVTLIAEGKQDALSTVLTKYADLAAATESSVDASFNSLYNAVVAELVANGHSASHADVFKSSYESAKERLKAQF